MAEGMGFSAGGGVVSSTYQSSARSDVLALRIAKPAYRFPVMVVSVTLKTSTPSFTSVMVEPEALTPVTKGVTFVPELEPMVVGDPLTIFLSTFCGLADRRFPA